MLARDPTRTGQQEEGLSRDSVIRFGRLRVLPRARQLLVDGRPVELGSRAFDLLMVLIRAPGVVLTKNEIISRVWPKVVVEQHNLKVQMAALRKVLNQDRDIIKTLHGRGYVFIGEVATASVNPHAFLQPVSEPTPSRGRPALRATCPFAIDAAKRSRWPTVSTKPGTSTGNRMSR